MKRLLFVVLITIFSLLPISGCYELMTTSNKDAITTSVDALMTRVNEFQNVFKEAGEANLIDAEETKKQNEKIDEIQEAVLAANDAIKESPTLIEGVIKANQATAMVNPYAGVIDAVLKIIAGSAVVGGTAATAKIVKDGKEKRRLIKESAKSESKLKATNRANEKLRMKHPDIAEEHYELVGAERQG